MAELYASNAAAVPCPRRRAPEHADAMEEDQNLGTQQLDGWSHWSVSGASTSVHDEEPYGFYDARPSYGESVRAVLESRRKLRVSRSPFPVLSAPWQPNSLVPHGARPTTSRSDPGPARGLAFGAHDPTAESAKLLARFAEGRSLAKGSLPETLKTLETLEALDAKETLSPSETLETLSPAETVPSPSPSPSPFSSPSASPSPFSSPSASLALSPLPPTLRSPLPSPGPQDAAVEPEDDVSDSGPAQPDSSIGEGSTQHGSEASAVPTNIVLVKSNVPRRDFAHAGMQTDVDAVLVGDRIDLVAVSTQAPEFDDRSSRRRLVVTRPGAGTRAGAGSREVSVQTARTAPVKAVEKEVQTEAVAVSKEVQTESAAVSKEVQTNRTKEAATQVDEDEDEDEEEDDEVQEDEDEEVEGAQSHQEEEGGEEEAAGEDTEELERTLGRIEQRLTDATSGDSASRTKSPLVRSLSGSGVRVPAMATRYEERLQELAKTSKAQAPGKQQRKKRGGAVFLRETLSAEDLGHDMDADDVRASLREMESMSLTLEQEVAELKRLAQEDESD